MHIVKINYFLKIEGKYIEIGLIGEEKLENEMQNVIMQLHLKKFSLAFLSDKSLAKQWAQYKIKIRNAKLEHLFGNEIDEAKFGEIKLQWQKLMEQIQIGSNISKIYMYIH